jgi:methionine sulfoxide reductase catalytic subunit
VPARYGIARARMGKSNWLNLLWLLPIGFVVLIVAVGFAQELRHVPGRVRYTSRRR